jgi:hypothetical protein
MIVGLNFDPEDIASPVPECRQLISKEFDEKNQRTGKIPS